MLQALGSVKNEKGQTLQQLNMLHSLDVKDGTVLVKLNLTSDYRKIKQIVTDNLK